MWFTPSSTARRRTAIAWARSGAAGRRIAPSPIRLTVRSPSCQVPAASAVTVICSSLWQVAAVTDLGDGGAGDVLGLLGAVRGEAGRLVEPAGPGVLLEHPEGRRLVAETGELGERRGHEPAAEALAPGLREQVDGAHLTGAGGIGVLVTGRADAREADGLLIGDRYQRRGLSGIRAGQGTGPCSRALRDIKLVEVHLRHHAAVGALP